MTYESERKKPLRLTKPMAEQIARKSFDYTVDCILGNVDPDYTLGNVAADFEDNFEEDLRDLGFAGTHPQIQMIGRAYEKMRNRLIKKINKAVA